MNKVIPLCPTVCCCPEIVYREDTFFIKDDYGNEIKIPDTQINKLIKDLDGILILHSDSMDN
jgi:hypothetical protein